MPLKFYNELMRNNQIQINFLIDYIFECLSHVLINLKWPSDRIRISLDRMSRM